MKDKFLSEQMENLSDVIDNFRGFISGRELFSKEIIDILKEVSKVSSEMNIRNFQFVETHNNIVNSLTSAEKEHWETLQSFLEQLHKRSEKIMELNHHIDIFNDSIDKTDVHVAHVSDTLKTLNTQSLNTLQHLKIWEENTKKQVVTVAKESFRKFFSGAKWLLVLNFLFTLCSLGLVYFSVKGKI